MYLAMELTSYPGEGIVTKLEVGIHFACMLSEVAHDFIVSSRELNKSSRIVCLAFDQVIELPVKHPELFEALGIDQPKVRFD